MTTGSRKLRETEENLRLLWNEPFLFVIAVAALLIVFLPPEGTDYAFYYYKNELVIASDLSEPRPLLETISLRKTFFVKASLSSEPSNENTSISNHFLIPALVVLNGNDKNAVTLAESIGASGELVECSTN